MADNNQWMDFTDDLGSNYLTLGTRLQRETFPAGLETIIQFVVWSKHSSSAAPNYARCVKCKTGVHIDQGAISV